MRFRTVIELGGKTATGIAVPAEVVESLGAGKRPPVRVTINGFTYRSTIAVMGGRYMVGVNAENRAGTGVAAGDEVDVDLELDTESREVEVPVDLAEALDRDPGVRRRFDTSAYSRRKEFVRSVEDAKTPETRARRIAKAVATLHEEAPG
ncbi:MAG TPA: YdeI/OmpD-associated family protein [Acidimicrobiales bacterium]|nr:YdeI/OmpD-associated family protein [Acidimicrobiales bacterium]